jgi:O-antigen/teichoic acid export membrane protein
MSSETQAAAPLTIDHKPHAAFFRQSGWMMMATIFGGMLTFGLHFLSKKISDGDYAIFVTLMAMVTCVPTLPLQMVFAQQSAEALAMNRDRQLAGMIRLAWIWTVILWLVGVFGVFVFHGGIVERWQLHDATGLWLTLPAVLVSLWMPLFSGVLQGRQDFFWLGWLTIIGGAARMAVAAIVVFAFRPNANGLMVGVLAGIGVSAVIGIWRTRDLWSKQPEPFDVKASLGKMIPLMLGFAASQFMFSSDTLFAKSFFSGEAMKPYAAAGTLSRALLWLVMPLAAVMFPKLVHSHAKSEKSNLFGIVVIGTGVLTACGAVCLRLVGPIVIRIVYKSSDVSATVALLPWYAGAMIPLGLANVLVNDLLARSRFGVVLPMVLLAVLYGFTLVFMLHRFPGRLEVVLQTLAAFNTLLLAVCAWFRWGIRARSPQAEVAQ